MDRWTEFGLTNASRSAAVREDTTLGIFFFYFIPFLDSIVWGNRCLRAMTGKASASPNNTELSLKTQIGVNFFLIHFTYVAWIIIFHILVLILLAWEFVYLAYALQPVFHMA